MQTESTSRQLAKNSSPISNFLRTDFNYLKRSMNPLLDQPNNDDKKGKKRANRGKGPRHRAKETPQNKSLSASAPEFKPGHSVMTSSSNETFCCDICAEENVQFVSIGPCDHPICSMCALRLRCKSNDKACPICKQEIEFTVICESVVAAKGFASFGVWGDTPSPGVDIDHQSGMLFVDIPEHFHHMNAMKSLICPWKGCETRSSSIDQLQKHVKDAHGQTFCGLCLQHRPLFIPEHMLMPLAQLKKHLNAPPAAFSGPKGDKTGGHPMCRFCNQHFFDTSELHKVCAFSKNAHHISHHFFLILPYLAFVPCVIFLRQHMRSRHFTCHLCPSAHQFRYYKNSIDLRRHTKWGKKAGGKIAH